MSETGSTGGNNCYGNKDWPKHFPPIPRNRFQKTGSDAVYEVKETDTCLIYRLDLPGCPASDLVYWVNGNNLHFFADEPVLPEYNHDGRKYGGSIVFDPAGFVAKGAKARLLNGVLWITVPKVPGSNIKLTFTEKMLNLNVTRDNVA
ncbi:hypothetical protein EUTSA_v10001063mg [Eutrema salsugineum]|uniref:SHSP domain-containing protein n=1 Tax=Eutrema salsugineum TaxID=72664 RepID=V4KPS2_EUTSA|nr:14.7 kDa heat shock protein [Eutrema salsugineum]ESQ39910.1 hypothetical protein EUTSA_v10001063mg [Eutrema salsugineum]